jgi:hypothetical protein
VGDRLRLVLRVARHGGRCAVRGTVVRCAPASGQIHEVGVAGVFAPYGAGAGDNAPFALAALAALEARFL